MFISSSDKKISLFQIVHLTFPLRFPLLYEKYIKSKIKIEKWFIQLKKIKNEKKNSLAETSDSKHLWRNKIKTGLQARAFNQQNA